MNKTAVLLVCLAVFQVFPGRLAAQNPGQDPLVVCLMADPQLVMVERTPEYVGLAMDDISGIDYDFMAVLGDLAQNRAHFYDNYREAVPDKAHRPVYSLAGNGDVGAGLDAYLEATGLPLYYAFNRRGIRFIFLSTAYYTGEHNHICNLGRDQLKWLRKELKSDTLSTTIVFSHPPMFETTWHSEERDHLRAPGSMYLGESLELKEMFRLYPNVRVFAHGHLHYAYGSKDEYGRGGYFSGDGILHISVGATANNRGSSFLYVSDEGILIRVRDHENGEWKKEHEYRLEMETTLAEPGSDPEREWESIEKRLAESKK